MSFEFNLFKKSTPKVETTTSKIDELNKTKDNKFLAKKVVLGAVMLSGIASGASGVEKTDKDVDINTNKIETESKINKIEGAYFVTASDFKDNDNKYKSELIYSRDKVEFQAINRFEVDSHIILDSAKEDIGKDFQELLNKVTPENFNEIMKKGITIYAYSDPRLTNKYKDNEELSLKRAEEMEKTLIENLSSKGAHSTNLTAELNKQLENIKFNIKIPESGPQKGVLYPKNLGIDTSGMSKEEIEKIYDQCRGVIVSLEVENNDHLKELKNKEPEIPVNKEEKITRRINWNAPYVYINFDKSPSIGHKGQDKAKSFELFIKQMTNDEKLEGSEIHLRFFSNKLGEDNICSSLGEVIDNIKNEKFNGGLDEKTNKSALELIKEIPNSNFEKTLISYTDEDSQYSNLNMLNSLKEVSLEKNLNYNIIYRSKNGNMRVLDLDDIKSISEKQLIKDISGLFKEYMKSKSIKINEMQDASSKIEHQKNLKLLQNSLENNSIDGLISNPLIKEIYPENLYPNVKEYLYNRTINPTSLENTGQEIILQNKV